MLIRIKMNTTIFLEKGSYRDKEKFANVTFRKN